MTEQERELSAIRRLLDSIDEFDEPLDPECVLPPLAQRVFDQLCEWYMPPKCACGKTLHSIAEGKRRECSSCWWKRMKPETKSAMNRLISAAFNGADGKEKDAAIDGAFAALASEEKK